MLDAKEAHRPADACSEHQRKLYFPRTFPPVSNAAVRSARASMATFASPADAPATGPPAAHIEQDEDRVAKQPQKQQPELSLMVLSRYPHGNKIAAKHTSHHGLESLFAVALDAIKLALCGTSLFALVHVLLHFFGLLVQQAARLRARQIPPAEVQNVGRVRRRLVMAVTYVCGRARSCTCLCVGLSACVCARARVCVRV